MFADDTLLYCAAKTASEAISKINHDLNKIYDWLNFHKLSLNMEKTSYMIISLKPLQNVSPDVILNGIKITKSNCYKYLGVIIDENLTFNRHLEYIQKKLYKKLGVFKRINNKLSKASKIIFYKSLVAPHFDYCSTILFIMNKSQTESVQVIQNKCMRIILNVDRLYSRRQMLLQLDWMSVNHRLHYNTLKFIHGMVSGKLPRYLNKHLMSNREVHNYNTRNFHYRLPGYKKSSSQQSILHKGMMVYNNLQTFFKDEELKTFSTQKIKPLIIKYISNEIPIFVI